MDRRSTLDIIWSCSTTLLACVWVAFHPPLPSSGPDAPLFYRLLFTKPLGSIGVLVAPEVMLTTAFDEWLRARISLWKLRRWASQAQRRANATSSNEIGLSQVTSTGSQAHEMYPRQNIYPPRDTDYSFSKEWTMTHVIFFNMGGLRLVVNGVPVADDHRSRYWAPDILFLVKRKHIPLREINKKIQDRSKGDWFSKTFTCVQTSWFLIQCVARAVRGLPISELEISTVGFVVITLFTYLFWWNKPLDVRTEVPIAITDKALQELQAWSNHYDPEGEHYYVTSKDYRAPNIDSSIRLCFVLFGCVFGGIHCLAWSFHFPTEIERTLWRVCSVTVTAAPPISTGFYHWTGTGLRDSVDISNLHLLFRPPRTLSLVDISRWFISVISTSLAIAYALARLALVIESLLCLRSMPSGVFETVSWTTFFPHV